MDSQNKPKINVKKSPIGVDDFKKLIDNDLIYVDKTLLIKEFWESGSEVTLVTRPRRFGKSIALSTLKYFFEKTDHSTAYLFENYAIWQKEEFRKIQGTHPLIFLSFKDIKSTTWESAFSELKTLLTKELRRTLGPLSDKMPADYQSLYQSLINQSATKEDFNESLLFITENF